MGFKTCASMLGGAILGYAMLGPIAYSRKWTGDGPFDLDKIATGSFLKVLKIYVFQFVYSLILKKI